MDGMPPDADEPREALPEPRRRAFRAAAALASVDPATARRMTRHGAAAGMKKPRRSGALHRDLDAAVAARHHFLAAGAAALAGAALPPLPLAGTAAAAAAAAAAEAAAARQKVADEIVELQDSASRGLIQQGYGQKNNFRTVDDYQRDIDKGIVVPDLPLKGGKLL